MDGSRIIEPATELSAGRGFAAVSMREAAGAADGRCDRRLALGAEPPAVSRLPIA